MKRNFAILVTVFFLGTVAIAQDENDENKCCCDTAQTSACLLKIEKNVDAELDKKYRSAIEELKQDYSPEDIANLAETQKLWAAYRIAACNAEYGLYGGGSAGPSVRSLCMIRIGRQRVSDIKSAYRV